VWSGGCSEGGFTHESGQRVKVAPDIGQHDQGPVARETKEREAFEAPGLEGGVASFRGIARTVVEGFPHGAADSHIANQADGTIGKALAHIEQEAAGAVGVEVGASEGRLGDRVEGDHRFCALGARAATEILATLALGIIAISSEAIAERTEGSALVIVAPQQPVVWILVGFMGTQVQDTTSLQVMVGNAEDQIGAEGGVTSEDIDIEGGIQVRELCEQSRYRGWFGLVGGTEIISEDETEASAGLNQKQGQGAITVDEATPTRFLFVRVFGFVGTGVRLVAPLVNDKSRLRITGGGVTTSAGAGEGVTVAPLFAFRLSRASPWPFRRGGFITTVLHIATA